ncbi:MAG: Glyoxalase family protein, partial [uncultured Nocardioides sp.]
ERPPHHRLHRARRHRPGRVAVVLRAGVRLAVQRLRPDLRRHQVGLGGRGGGRSRRGRRPGAGRLPRPPLLRRPGGDPGVGAGRRRDGHRGPLRLPRRPAVPLQRQQRQRAGGLDRGL